MQEDQAGDVTPCRWAILGTGAVARKFVLGLAQSSSAGTAAIVASRDRSNAARMAAELGIPAVADSFEDAVRSDAVDAVYVATPPSLHRPHALAAIAAGKAVLVEKPFAMNGSEAEEIAAAARAAGVFCMEGLWTRFLPLLAVLRTRLAEGAIGEVVCFEASFCAPVLVEPGQSMFDPDRGGGALMHRGVYPLSLARDLLGPVSELSATSRGSSTGVDEEVLIHLRHESGALSSVRASIAAPGHNSMSIFGTTGTIDVRAPIYRPWAMRETRVQPSAAAPRTDPRKEALRESALAQGSQQRVGGLMGLVRRSRDTRTVARYHGNGYAAEAEALVRDLAAGRTENALMPLDQSIEVMHLIDQARAAQPWSR